MHNVWPNEFQQQNRLDHFTLLRLVFSAYVYGRARVFMYTETHFLVYSPAEYHPPSPEWYATAAAELRMHDP